MNEGFNVMKWGWRDGMCNVTLKNRKRKTRHRRHLRGNVEGKVKVVWARGRNGGG